MTMPALETSLVGLIDAIDVDTGQDVVQITEAEVAIPMEVGVGPAETGLLIGARAAMTQMRTGFETPLSTVRINVVRVPAGEAP